MNLYIIVFLLLICQFISLKPNLNKSIVQRNRQWTRFQIIFDDTQSPLTYLYDQYPLSWNPVFSYIYVHNDKLINNTRYPLKIRVKDSHGNIWSGSIILEYRNQQMNIHPQIYSYDQSFPKQFFESDGFSGETDTVINYITLKELGARYKPNVHKVQQQNRFIEEIESLSTNPGSSSPSINERVIDIQKQQEKKLIGVPSSLINLLRRNSLGYRDYYETPFQYGSYGSNINQPMNLIPSEQQISVQVQQQVKTKQPQVNKIPSNTQTKKQTNTQANTQANTQTNLSTNLPLYNLKQTESTLSIPIDQIFLRLPSRQQLDQIILKADSLALLKTIQNVIRSSLNCSDKVYYLQDFLGRVNSAASMKKFASSQLQVIIQAATEQIQRLIQQVNQQKQRLQELGIKKQKQDLQKELQILQNLYNQFNNIELSIQPEYAKIGGFQVQIQNLRTSNDEYRSLLAEQQLKETQIDSDIQKLEKALNNAKNKKSSIRENIENLENQIQSSEQKIKNDYQQIQKLQQEIEKLQKLSDSVKIQSKTQEIIVERIQNNLIKNQQKQDGLQSRIQQLQEKIRLQSLKLATQQLKSLKYMVQTLQNSIPSLQEQIDRFNYQCLQLTIQNSQKKGNQLVYIIGQKDYTQYIKNIYGDVQIKNSQIKSSLQLSSLSILSPLWISTYGNPFSKRQIIGQQQFAFSQDFNCLQPSKIQNGSGIIRQIRSRQIFVEITDNERRQQIRIFLGACSRIQSTTITPKLGQSIYWQGKIKSDNNFNAYRITCL